MKKAGKRFLVLLLAALLLCSSVKVARAQEPAGYVVMSVEKLTLGQGFIMEPQRVPYYEGENMAQVLERALTGIGRSFHYTGTLTDGFYLAEIEDPNRSGIANTVPSYIYEMWSALKAGNPSIKSISDTDTLEPDYLGEFDYFGQSGWMYSINDAFPPVGAANSYPADGLVVRWQFTLVGLGGDLGGTGTTAAGSKKFMNRTELYTVMASVRENEVLMADSEIRAAYDRVLMQCADITLEKTAIESDLDLMKKALGGNQITKLSLPSRESGVRTCGYGTDMETAMRDFPTYLMAQVDGESKIITGVTWTLDSQFGPPGNYMFRPVLPDKYGRYTLLAEPPVMQVTVLPPSGDVTGDALLNIRDISRMAASAGREDRLLCDLDGSGTVTWNDFRLLTALLGSSALDASGAPDTVPLSVTFDKETYAAGEQAVAYVEAPDAGFDTFMVALSFDADKLAFQSLQLTDPLLETAVLETEEGLRFSGASLEGAVQGGTVAAVTFTVQADGVPEITVLSDGTALLYNGDYLAVTANVLKTRALSLRQSDFLWGDVDGNGEIDVVDAGLLIQFYSGLCELTNQQLTAADVNGDGEADTRDAALLIRYCNGLIDSFPVEIGS